MNDKRINLFDPDETVCTTYSGIVATSVIRLIPDLKMSRCVEDGV
jgi:hypothetical protein